MPVFVLSDNKERSRKHLRIHGYTLVEILVVIAIIALLAALLFPLSGTVRSSARRGTCFSNLHQLGIAAGMYLQDADGAYPRAINPADAAHPERWREYPAFESAIRAGTLPQYHAVLASYTANVTFRCPSDTGLLIADPYPGWLLAAPLSCYDSFGTSYFYHSSLARQHSIESRLKSPAEVVLLSDASGLWHGMKTPDFSAAEHRYNVLFADLHIRTLPQTEFAKYYSQM